MIDLAQGRGSDRRARRHISVGVIKLKTTDLYTFTTAAKWGDDI